MGLTTVFDPKLVNTDGSPARASLGGRVETVDTRNYSATFTILDASGVTVRRIPSGSRTTNTTWWTTWDGANDSGASVAPGRYTVRLDAAGDATGSTSRSIYIVRLGARALKFADGSPTRIPLAYHAAGGFNRSYFAVDSAGPQWTLPLSSLGTGTLDDSAGRPLAGPAPWTDAWSPPMGSNGVVTARGRSLPVAYTGGAKVNVTLTLGDRAVSKGQSVGCGYPITTVPIRVRAGGTASGAISPGNQVTVDLGAALPWGLGRIDRTVEVRFEYQEGGNWYSIPGRQATRHQIYTLIGGSKLSTSGGASSDAREMPFVAAVDEACVSFATPATTQTAAGALDAITRAVYSKKGLTYDTYQGMSAYYDSGDLWSPDFAFSDFLSGQSRGNVINCTDCANIVSTYARSVGVDMKIVILGSDFRLNFIKGIGSSQWKKDIFDWGGDAFSYHAVASTNAGSTVHDACLAVDDGPNPGSFEARVERLPIDMSLDRYRQKLSPDWFSIQSVGRATQY